MRLIASHARGGLHADLTSVERTWIIVSANGGAANDVMTMAGHFSHGELVQGLAALAPERIGIALTVGTHADQKPSLTGDEIAPAARTGSQGEPHHGAGWCAVGWWSAAGASVGQPHGLIDAAIEAVKVIRGSRLHAPTDSHEGRAVLVRLVAPSGQCFRR